MVSEKVPKHFLYKYCPPAVLSLMALIHMSGIRQLQLQLQLLGGLSQVRSIEGAAARLWWLIRVQF